MRLTITIALIFLGSSGLFGQKYTLQDTIFNSGEILISYDVIFNFNEDTFDPESFIFLDSIAVFLVANPDLFMEVGQHCDERGPKETSIDLTTVRAEAITRCLVSKGINPERLIAKGYKDRRPLIKGAKTEEEHQMNRRTEFKVLKNEYIACP